MSKMIKCMNCNTVYEKKGINLLLLVILFMLGVVPAIIYLIVRKNKCPMCGLKN